MKTRPARVAFVSPSGLGNLGDAAIIDSLIAGLRRRRPTVEIVGFTLNPADTVFRHGVEAAVCGAFSLPHYTVRRGPRSDGLALNTPASDGLTPPPLRLFRQAIGALPGARQSRSLAVMALADWRHRHELARRLAGFDQVVVSGGGQLDEFWGGPFGHPYTLYRFGRAARRAGARFDVLSVGTGTLSTRLGRRFVRHVLAGAGYRSFRDERSRELAVAAGAAVTDPIVPDLAYALPISPSPPPSRGRRLIGVAPMCYADPRFWPKPDAARHQHHLRALAAVAVRAIREGHEVSLFATDRPDAASVAECHAIAADQLTGDERARLRSISVEGVAPLLALLGACDAVVAARFHGVLLAHVVGRPVLALSHERKVATLMSEVGHDRYCLPIDDTDPVAAGVTLGELLSRQDALAAHIRQVAADYRRRVEAQYDTVFGVPP